MIEYNYSHTSPRFHKRIESFMDKFLKVFTKKQIMYLNRFGVCMDIMPKSVVGYATNKDYRMNDNSRLMSDKKYYIYVQYTNDFKDTIAHEFAHVILGHCTFKHLCSSKDNVDEKDEVDANKLAKKWLCKLKIINKD